MRNPYTIRDTYAILANRISRYHYEAAAGDLDQACTTLTGIPEAFERCWRSLNTQYECSMPLFWLYTLHRGSAADFNYTDMQYRVQIEVAETGCRQYFELHCTGCKRQARWCSCQLSPESRSTTTDLG
ncbi:hypothetical protein LEM8419_03475 [Neolewinella maritima]|uniref:Uncharacterized protein n=1 Tax=Neolewinella maritima TaxID=1383882 RepID=A0ABN8F7N1_9BACT|nr:hypothetical protein [Neolewinella maritima]CAH1002603.1 hypothetical protein LEM8419_03475 [Neolewinella maritima]